MFKHNKLQEELKKTREDLNDLELYMQNLISFLPVAYCLLSGIGNIVDINEAFEDLTGYSLENANGISITKLFQEGSIINAFLDRAKNNEVVKNKEFTLISKGRETPVSVSISARRDKEDNFIGFFLAINDITEYKNLQRELERKVDKRTEELYKRLVDLERFRRLTEGRELTMIKLKEENKRLRDEKNKNGK